MPKRTQASFNGELALNVAGPAPHYRFEGKLEDVAYKGGHVDFEGSLDAEGSGIEIVNGAHAEGCLHARSISFAPDAEFRSAKGCFEMSMSASATGTAMRWKLPESKSCKAAIRSTGRARRRPMGAWSWI